MNFKLGEVDTYPDSTRWERMCQIPVRAAVQWAAEVCPGSVIGTTTNETAWMALQQGDPDRYWLNKVMVVVQVRGPGFGPVALYKHDGTYWVLRHRIK